MTTQAEWSELDKEIVLLAAEKASSPEGNLDPARVARFAKERRIGVSEAYAVLRSALQGRYAGDAEALRASSHTEMARRRARRRGVALGVGAIELSGTSTPEGSERGADAAARYAEEHEVPYEVALVEVQKLGGVSS
jgi:sirohydrochlorin ferrochelatase